jgi:magnesium-transporting ATPase (P-type)
LILIAVLGVLGLKILALENKKFWMTVWTICIVAAAAAAWVSGGEAAVKDVLRFFMIAVTIIVVAVPEGLPMAIFIALGLGMRKIREDNNLVRKMVAAETIGSATVICTDKTGTLTKNQMEVTEVYFGGQRFAGQDVLSLKDLPGFDLLSVGCAIQLDCRSGAFGRRSAFHRQSDGGRAAGLVGQAGNPLTRRCGAGCRSIAASASRQIAR